MRPGLVAIAGFVLCGCSTPTLNSARHNFYAGRFQQADQSLTSVKIPEQDRVLFLMERGMIRQAEGKYDDSSKDFIDASDLIDQLVTYSVSKGAASWVANDNVENFRGAPFERTLLHAFTANNHMARGDWDNAAVEARRIIKTLNPEQRGDYPDCAYARYLAGFCFEMIDDDSNAALQYRKASDNSTETAVDPNTGHLKPKPPKSTNQTESVSAENLFKDEKRSRDELICFVSIGHAPRPTNDREFAWRQSSAMYATILSNGKVLGRSYNLSDTVELAFTTEQIEAVRKMAKTVGRVIVKEAIADSIEENGNNELLGEFVRFILIGLLEQPDVRAWETLPRWLQVARVPCPPDLTSYDVEFKTANGATLRTLHVEAPIARRRNIFVSFCRDIVTPSVPAVH